MNVTRSCGVPVQYSHGALKSHARTASVLVARFDCVYPRRGTKFRIPMHIPRAPLGASGTTVSVQHTPPVSHPSDGGRIYRELRNR